MDYNQFKEQVIRFNSGFDFDSAGMLWSENTEKNLARCKKSNSIHCLQGLFKEEQEKAVIVVGASPALKRDASKLKGINKNHFCIIAANSALKFLLKKAVVPDFVIAIDGDKTNIVNHLDVGDISKDIQLIASNCVAPEIWDVWKGETIWWTSYYQHLRKELRSKIRYRIGKHIPFGGNSITLAMSIAVLIFDSRMIIFVGTEGCYGNRYYVDKISEWEGEKRVHFPVKDIKGRDRYTNIPLYMYNSFTEQVADNSPGVTFIDTSFGLLGIDSKRINVMELTEAINKVNEAFHVKHTTRDWHEVERIKYNAAYCNGYLAKIGESIWKEIFRSFRFDNVNSVLDIGCGIGAGVAMCRNAGLDAYGTDIADAVVKYWKQANIDKFCHVCPADRLPFSDNEFDVVVCTEMLEHVPEEGILDTLKEIYRVGKSDFILTIGIQRAKCPFPHNGQEPHITVKEPEWWTERLHKAEFKDIYVSMSTHQTSILVIAKKHNNEGLLLTGNGKHFSREYLKIFYHVGNGITEYANRTTN